MIPGLVEFNDLKNELDVIASVVRIWKRRTIS